MTSKHHDPWRVGKDEAYQVECPKCLAPVGHHCVYVAPRLHLNHERSQTCLAALKRAGTATKVPHIERYSAARDKRTTGYIRRPGRAHIRPKSGRMNIVKAERDYELKEHMALREWLKQHGDIFLLSDSVLP
jgi:hypothetical protein